MPLESAVYWDKMEPTENRRFGRIVSTLAQVADFLREHGYFDEAIEALNALSWGDDSYECGDYAYDLGLCHEAKGDLAKALHFYEIALRENPPVLGRAEAVERLRAVIAAPLTTPVA